MSTELTITPTSEQLPAPLFTPTPRPPQRMLEFFTAQINNPHTRRAYLNAARRFAAWCQDHRIGQLSSRCSRSTSPLSFRTCRASFRDAPATVKQHLAALRVLFDWLVTGHILQLNPAHAVRGPRYSLKRGKTPVLTAPNSPRLARQHPDRPDRAARDGTETGGTSLLVSWVCAIGRSSAPWFTPSPASAPSCG